MSVAKGMIPYLTKNRDYKTILPNTFMPPYSQRQQQQQEELLKELKNDLPQRSKAVVDVIELYENATPATQAVMVGVGILVAGLAVAVAVKYVSK
ncbi:MAG: hypothetical protein ACRYFX_09265 [Janthinobacterium lividum]